jgi:hypothetical protein
LCLHDGWVSTGWLMVGRLLVGWLWCVSLLLLTDVLSYTRTCSEELVLVLVGMEL